MVANDNDDSTLSKTTKPEDISHIYTKAGKYDKQTVEKIFLAAQQGDSTQQIIAGYIYMNGASVAEGVTQDLKQAKKLFEEAIETREGRKEICEDAYLNLAWLYLRGGIDDKPDYKEAAQLYLNIPENLAACIHLGEMYEKGLGVEQDYQEAEKFYSKAAAKGNPVALNCLGLILKRKVLKLFNLAADQGYMPAKINLDLMSKAE